MMLVAVPESNSPGNMFGTAVARVTDIGLGLVCCTMVDSIIVPRSLGPQMRERLHAWLPDVQRWFEEALEGRDTDPEATADRLRMIGDEIGRAHVLTPVTNAQIVCRLLLEKKT